MDRAHAIGAEYLVTHPGNYRGQSVEQGIAAVSIEKDFADTAIREISDGHLVV